MTEETIQELVRWMGLYRDAIWDFRRNPLGSVVVSNTALFRIDKIVGEDQGLRDLIWRIMI